jgi:hypothetical protein
MLELKQDSIFFFGSTIFPSLIRVALSSNQTQPQGLSLWCFTWVHFHVFRSDQYFCLDHEIYDSILLEHLNNLVVEPINDILIFAMFGEKYIGQSAIVLETCENHLCVITKYVFWMLEVTFSLWFMCNC